MLPAVRPRRRAQDTAVYPQGKNQRTTKRISPPQYARPQTFAPSLLTREIAQTFLPKNHLAVIARPSTFKRNNRLYFTLIFDTLSKVIRPLSYHNLQFVRFL